MKQDQSHRLILQEVSDQCSTFLGHDALQIQIGDDFDEYYRIVSHERAAQRIGYPFHPTTLIKGATPAVWLTARSLDGVLLHTQALKQIDLVDQSLSEYFNTHFVEFPPPWSDIDPSLSSFHETPGTRKISGLTAYHGDFWSHEFMRSGAGQFTSYTFGQLANHLAHLTINPDWMFGFILDGVYNRGFAAKLEYLNLEPRCLRWYRKESLCFEEAGIVYSSKADLAYVRDVHASRTEQKFA